MATSSYVFNGFLDGCINNGLALSCFNLWNCYANALRAKVEDDKVLATIYLSIAGIVAWIDFFSSLYPRLFMSSLVCGGN